MTDEHKCGCDETTWALVLASEADAVIWRQRDSTDAFLVAGVIERAELVQLGDDVHLAQDEGDEHWSIAADPSARAIDLDAILRSPHAERLRRTAIRSEARAELLLELHKRILDMPRVHIRTVLRLLSRMRIEFHARDAADDAAAQATANEGTP